MNPNITDVISVVIRGAQEEDPLAKARDGCGGATPLECIVAKIIFYIAKIVF